MRLAPALACLILAACATTPEQRAGLRLQDVACKVDRESCGRIAIHVVDEHWPRAEILGNRMTISIGMLAVAESDDALAFVVGHEIAHARLAHRPVEGDNRRATKLEIEADALGYALATKAGYDGRAGADLLRRILARARQMLRPPKEAIRQLERRRVALERLIDARSAAR